jgi:hypothetical protein
MIPLLIPLFFGWTISLNVYNAGIFKHSMGARNRVGIGLPYRPARLYRLEELIPWKQFFSSLKV